MNHMLRTVALMSAITVLIVVIGSGFAGQAGAWIGLLFALGANVISYWNSDTFVLYMTGARPLDANDTSGIPQLVADLAHRAQLPTPKVYIIESATPNAFATGRDPAHGVVAVTSGIIQSLQRDELAGVIAHELTHIKNRDTLIGAISATMAGVITQFAYVLRWTSFLGGNRQRNGSGLIGSLAMLFIAPLAATLLNLGISRTREFAADEGAAEITGKPLALADALRKIEAHAHTKTPPAFAKNPATAPLFIINPLQGIDIASWFSTHPPTAERIARLQALAHKTP
jgi:heat shock protein HtpX